MAISWPPLVLVHPALFTYIAPFIRKAGPPDYAINLALPVLGALRPHRHLDRGYHRGLPAPPLVSTTAAIAMIHPPLGSGTIPGPTILMTVWGAGLGAIGTYNQPAILRAGRDQRRGQRPRGL